ncbi:DivIVA domain-containing protein [Parvibacter caecicola]|uniref:Cell wall synthesis protein Wag31 n=1 Tax=Parvibacter caecicola TaxID=747645 RepID=A0A3N0A946_9ACTN|nr:DivIVA domain-containing protein [Parvibacter caecicola]MBB3170273.1 DivIVA domain-containing protein [Parvibacter caecicola]MCR2041760.1 DivIVA domain-containing protein [Parvibacter caecicola]RNL10484.1 cell division protein DivIVA [Parvibacter caecicola]TJW12478.1 DivIVA domain-containing protein [Parvibacter caecicola]
MSITSNDIHNQSFSIDRKGYDVDEVDVFLEHVADEIDQLNDIITRLQNQLYDAQETSAVAPVAMQAAVVEEVDTSHFDVQIADQASRINDLERQLNEKRADDNAVAQALIIAQRTADEVIMKANAQASETIADAREEAQRIIDRANVDRQNVIDSIRRLQDDRETARDAYSVMLKDIITDASRKLASISADSRAVEPADFVPAAAPGVTNEFEIDEYVNPAPRQVSYTTPQATDAVVAAEAAVASPYEKDLSGFGDADAFEFEDVD